MEAITHTDLNYLIKYNKLVFVFISADWCNSCALFRKTYGSLEHKFRSFCRFVILDYTSNKELMEKLEISRTPSVIVFKDGHVCEIIQGTQREELYENILSSTLS